MKTLSSLVLAASLLTGGCDGEHNFGGPSGPDVPVPGRVGTPPSYGATVEMSTPPPPLSGGTLLALRDDATAVAADPDRDRVVIVDLKLARVRATLALAAGDEPGRLVEDTAGRVHVVLRRGGAVVDIDPGAGTLLGRRPVCAIPRGIDYDPATDRLWVACMGGQLVALPAAGGAAVATYRIDTDLRDVVVDETRLRVTVFRRATLLTIDKQTGAVLERVTPPSLEDKLVRRGARFTPSVAWRAVRDPLGGVLVAHQRGEDQPPPDGTGGQSYGGGPCDAMVHGAITSFLSPSAVPVTAPASNFTSPIDIAVSADGLRAAVVNAGRSRFAESSNQVLEFGLSRGHVEGCQGAVPVHAEEGEAVAVAWRPSGGLLVQSRQPSMVTLDSGRPIPLGGAEVADSGHLIFHTDSGTGIACMSCHPEGGEDGRVWNVFGVGPRRTLSLRGGVTQRAPFHWSGDMPSLQDLMLNVFSGRMGGLVLDGAQLGAMEHFLASIPALPAPTEPADAVARGRALFEGAAACNDCHNGAQLANRTVVDVGTGGPFKVPSLRGLAWRAPYLHDGCATTLADRFALPCGGLDRHGTTSRLSAPQLDDLVAYLRSL